MKQKILAFFGVVAVTWGMVFGTLQATPAAAVCDKSFLGFVPWYNGLQMDAQCNIVELDAGADGEGIAAFAWKIVANILIDMFMAVGYLAVGFFIYGGYMYIVSSGDPNRTAKGKSILIAATIGLVIALLANVIIRTIMLVLVG